ncbi:putative Ig domain-containing protein, partial [Leucobacter sp. M11]|uniref:putative Ig domain-containing protein n=1 Tax=Leucobacter sp. M11 TaxID=2993565 RepID=UPI002D80E485
MQNTHRPPGRGALAVLLGTALALAPALAGSATEPVPESAGQTTTSFAPKLSTDIVIGEEVQPNSILVTRDGTVGFVTDRVSGTLSVLDLAENRVSDTVALNAPRNSALALSPDESLLFLVEKTPYGFSRGIGVVDLGTMSLRNSLTPDLVNIEVATPNRDGSTVVALGLGGEVLRLDASTGEVLASTVLAGNNFHSAVYTEHEAELLIGGDRQLIALDPLTLDTRRIMPIAGVRDLNDLTFDRDFSRVYVADGTGTALAVLDPGTGAVLSSANMGTLMDNLVGDDTENRAYGNAQLGNAILAADLAAGLRATGTRDTPAAPFDVVRNPQTGDLLSANAGWTNGKKGSTVSVIHAPGVTDPGDQTVSAPGENVTFRSEVTGISPEHGGGVQWQRSADAGATWQDVPGATGDALTLSAPAEAIGDRVRLTWSDDFWGTSGTSGEAVIRAQGPRITYEGPLPEGVVGETYPGTEITATGLPGLRWSVTGLPEGLRLAPETGLLTGTPAAEGLATLTVTVEDDFGADTATFPLTVRDGTGT